MQALEMEEAESLVRGTGRKTMSNFSNVSRQRKAKGGEGLAYVVIQRDFVTVTVALAMLAFGVLLYVSSHGAGGTDANYFPDAAGIPDDDSLLVEPLDPAPIALTTTDPPQVESTTAATEPAKTTAEPITSSTATPPENNSNAKNLYSKFATFIPLVEPPLPDAETAKKLAEKFGKWNFWDGDEGTRPTDDYLSAYPNKDCPGNNLPDDSWQVDAVFVNHYLNDADKLISRAMDAIFAEYGHPREGMQPVQLVERMAQFHWDKIDMADATSPPPKYQKGGNRGNGGWTTKRSEKGLVRRLLHAMMTSDTFTVVMGGHSAAAGEGNHFRQNYMMQFHKVMAPIFARLGVQLITRNVGMGGLGTLHNAMGSGSTYGDEVDLLIWDSGMTEGRESPAIDMFLRQGLIGGQRVPVIWGNGIPFDLLKNIHENADADIGEFGQARDLLPKVETREQAGTIPWAARFLECTDGVEEICKEEPRFCALCWIDREDDITPIEKQNKSPKGQVSWHPGWRSHQLVGRNLAMAVLQSLQSAVNIWNENVASGPPLADEFWHVTDYYTNIQNKVMNMKAGSCYDYEGKLPTRMCHTPMKALTHYTPRANPEKTGINVFVKPTADGYVPLNEEKNLFDGPNPTIPCLQIPEGEIDVYAIVAGRRRLSGEVASWNTIEQSQHSSVVTATEPEILFTGNRSLETGIVPGKGWQLFGEPPGYCDGTYNSICNRASDCVLQGNQVGRGALIGNEFSGWLVVTLNNLKEGMIVLKLHTWHYSNENTITEGWTNVNNEPQRLRERKLDASTSDDYQQSIATSSTPAENQRRSLGVRSTDTPAQPDTMIFEYAIDGKITTLARDEFLQKLQELQRVVQTLTILDDPGFTSEPRDVEIAIRMRGCERQCSFGLSHVYWA